MKKILAIYFGILTLFLFVGSNSVLAQNDYPDGSVNLKLWVNQLWRYKYGDAGFGDSEDSYRIQLRDNSNLDGSDWLLSTNSGDGNNGWCFQDGGSSGSYPRYTPVYNRLMLNYTYAGNNPKFYDIYYDTWEDDKGDRCKYETGGLDPDDDRCGPGTVTAQPIRSLGAPCVENLAPWQYFCGTSSSTSTAARIKVYYSTPKPITSLTVNTCNAVITSSIDGAGSYSGCTYTWEKQGVGTVGSGQSITVSSPGSYRVSYNCNGCNNTSDWVVVTAPNPAPTPGSISGNQTICAGGSITALTSVSAGTGIGGTVSYQWQSSTTDCNSGWLDISGATSATFTPPTLGQTTYFRRATVDCWGRTVYSNCVTITVIIPPTAGTISGNQSICINGSQSYTSSVSGGAWSSSNTSIFTINSSGVATPVAIGSADVVYTVNDGVCPVVSVNLPVSVVALPDAGQLSGTTSICLGSTGTLVSSMPNGTWSSSNTSIATVNNLGVVSGVASGSATISYTVSGNGVCADDVATTTVQVVNTVVPTVTITGSSVTNICTGDNISLTATTTNGGSNPSYQWQLNGLNISGATNSTFSISGSGLSNGDVITVILTSNDPCANPTTVSDNTAAVVVQPTVNPGVTISGAPTTSVCTGSSITFTANPTYGGTSPSYIWQVNGVDLPSETGATFTSSTLNNGDVVSVVMTSSDACATPSVVSASTSSSGLIIGDTQAPVWSDCPGNIVVDGGSSCEAKVTWDEPTVTDNCGTPTVTQNHYSGEYYPVGVTQVIYTATDADGNTSTCSFTITVTDSEAPTVVTCVSDYVVYSTASSCQVALANYTNAPELSVSDNCGSMQAGTFTITQNPTAGTMLSVGNHPVVLTVADPSGNTTTCTFNVEVKDTISPAVSVTLDSQLNCEGQSVTWTESISDNCGISSVTSTHQSGEAFNLGTTVVTYTVTDVNGNTTHYSFNVVVEETPEVSQVLGTLNGELKGCLGGDVVLVVTNESQDNGYLWFFDNDQVGNEATYTVLAATAANNGVYTVVAENQLGCTSSAEIELLIEVCEVTVSEAFSPNGDGQNDYFTIVNLNTYPNTSIWIYDRWGSEVYYSENYQNDWDGESTSAMTLGKDKLPEGTYFYVIKLGGAENQEGHGDVVKGFVYLKR